MLFRSFTASKAQTIDRLPCVEKRFSIAIHIVKDSSKFGNNYGLFTFQPTANIQANIQRAIDSLNNHFASICVSFQVCNFDFSENYFIENYWYLKLGSAPLNLKQMEEMEVLYNAKNRINLYYLIDTKKGLAYVDDTITHVNNGALFLTNYVTTKVLVQAMGQYFGLSSDRKSVV